MNSTVSGNTSSASLGTAIRVGGGALIENSTIAYNAQGGIAFSDVDFSRLTNSIVAHNGTLINNCAFIENLDLLGLGKSRVQRCGSVRPCGRPAALPTV